MFFSLILLLQIKETKATEYENLYLWMKDSGFENIQISELNDTLILSYENRVFRHEAEAIAHLIKNIPIPHKSTLIILPKYLNIAILQLKLDINDLEQFRQKTILLRNFINKIVYKMDTDQYKQEGKLKNASLFKADIFLEPKLSMQLGNYDRPIQALIEVSPTLQIHLGKGLQLKAQLMIPLYNNLKSMEDVSLRSGILNISQNFKLPDDFFVTASAGIFTYDRLGVDLKTKKYFLNGRIGLFTQMSYTTWAEFANEINNPYFDKDNYFIGRIGTEYRYAKYDLLISASYGSFLYQDKGWRFDLFRQFNQVIIGFVGIKTRDDYNAGFYLSIPLLPKKHKQINKFRIRSSRYFNWGYNFRGQTHAGKNYSTGGNIISKSREFNPYYIQNQLIYLLKD
jgi:hypothetical protein